MNELTEKEKRILEMLLRIGIVFTERAEDIMFADEFLSNSDIYALADKLGVEIRDWL